MYYRNFVEEIMFRKILPVPVIMLLVLIVQQAPVAALDSNDDALKFIPADAATVMAFDMDAIMDYAGDVGDDWRDADVAHFNDALGALSDMLTTEAKIPDVFTFLGKLSGVQAVYMDPEEDIPLVILSADSRRDREVLAGYVFAAFKEQMYDSSLKDINRALRDYRGRTEVDEETEEEISPGGYPADIYDLVEFGYLDEMPLNPFTGEPINVVGDGDKGSLGDIYYQPYSGCGSCCPVDEGENDDEPEIYTSYLLKSWHIHGVATKDGWRDTIEEYEELDSILRDLLRELDFDMIGMQAEEENGFTFIPSPCGEAGMAYGRNYLLFGSSIDALKKSVETFMSGDGFAFDEVEDFDTSGAFYREQVDFPALYELYGPLPMMVLEGGVAHGLGLDDEILGMLEGIYREMGFNEFGMNYKACWLENDNIISVERMYFTGTAEGSFMDEVLTVEPEILMTAVGGPFEIIGEFAWANPDDIFSAYINFMLGKVLPLVASEMGGGEEIDPSMMLGMLGLGEIEELDFGDQVYTLLTASEMRSNGQYIPGLTTCLKTDSEDIAYVAVGMMDTMSLMVPDFPFTQMESDLENVYTWVLDMEEFPISPTIGWTDGWMVKGIWREDVITAIDAIENGTMFMPDGMQPANMRMHFNRQELLRGLADAALLVPEDESPLIAGMFEFAALLSNPDERLYLEVYGNDEWTETRSELSIGMVEDLVPVMSYLVLGMDAMH